ncbi:MAG: NUDIX domain-containing protein [Proteobacteria bacterium]|nr:NUDIX domain-containing protein [Pseudomonadota bacterium]
MSSNFDLDFPKAPVQPIRPAATVIVVREAASSYEIFMLKRTSKASFASGMYVFPGGRVDADDHLHAYDPYRYGPTEGQQPQVAALGDEWRGFWIACIRETFEEAGLMLAYTPDGELVSFADPNVQARFAGYRKPLHDGTLSLLDICRKENLKLAVDHIHFYNRFITPLGRPRRFDTRFFVAAAPESQRGSHDEQETVDSIWITPQQALARHAAKEFDLMNVTRIQLQALAQSADKAALLNMSVNKTRFDTRRPVLPK